MASQPVKRGMVEALAAKGRDLLQLPDDIPPDDAALAYICACLEQGTRISHIAPSVGVSRFLLDRWIRADKERQSQVLRARACGSDALVDEGGDLLDAATRDTIAVANARAGWRKWLAGKYDPETWGEKTQSGPVVYGDLHLHALQRPQALPSPSPAFPLPRSFPEAPPALGPETMGGGEVPIREQDGLSGKVGIEVSNFGTVNHGQDGPLPPVSGTPPSTPPVGECLSKNSTVSGEPNG